MVVIINVRKKEKKLFVNVRRTTSCRAMENHAKLVSLKSMLVAVISLMTVYNAVMRIDENTFYCNLFGFTGSLHFKSTSIYVNLNG